MSGNIMHTHWEHNNFPYKNNFGIISQKFFEKKRVSKFVEQKLLQNHQNININPGQVLENHEFACFDR